MQEVKYEELISSDVLIDIRKKDLFDLYHIKNAIHIDSFNGELNQSQNANRHVFYCQTGQKSKDYIFQHKYNNAVSLQAGVNAAKLSDLIFSDDFAKKINATKSVLKENFIKDKRPWVVAFSGGKDSTVVVQLVYELLLSLPHHERKQIYVILSDTKVESPIIEQYINKIVHTIQISARNQNLPLEVKIVQPAPNDQFWFNLIGKGYPSPTRTFRWCTDKLKIKPTQDTMNMITDKHGSCVLLLGTRKSESQNRQRTMESRPVNSRGMFPHDYIPNTLVFSPIAEWTNDEVWTYLNKHNPPPWESDHNELLSLYTQAHGGDCEFITNTDQPSCGSSRFGCWVCTVVNDDKSMKGFIDTGEEWLKPLYDFRQYLKDIRECPEKRSSFRRNGTYGPGPFTSDTRKEILEKLLQIEASVGVELISSDEIINIQKQWDNDFDIADSAIKISRRYDRMVNYATDNYSDENIFLHMELLERAAEEHNLDIEFISSLVNESLEIFSSNVEESKSVADIKALIEKTINDYCIPTGQINEN